MKLSQLIDHNKRNIEEEENYAGNEAGRLVPDLLFFKYA